MTTGTVRDDDYAVSSPGRNRIRDSDREIHDWYRFVLSYPPHLVRNYVEEFGLDQGSTVLDPFCGTGTTLVEAKKLGINSIGLETNLFAYFATQVKCNWDITSDMLRQSADSILGTAQRSTSRWKGDLLQLDESAGRLLIRDSISPLPLHRVLLLQKAIERNACHAAKPHLLLALGNCLKTKIGNLRFGPEVGLGPIQKDVCVLEIWRDSVETICRDLESTKKRECGQTEVQFVDARRLDWSPETKKINAVITSPPYPNEKDYTRATRLESVVLGFVKNRSELRAMKEGLLRSNTKNVFAGDDDDSWVLTSDLVQGLAERLEREFIFRKCDSGFEKLYSRVVRLYFGGLYRHLSALRPFLNKGAMLAYVVGDQASYFRIRIRTSAILQSLAEDLGYECVRTDLFRTRKATATRDELNEDVLILRWPGS